MKCYLYSNDPSFEFEEEVDSLEFSDIESFVDDFFSDEIYDCIFLGALSKKSQGFFPDPWEIETELFSQTRTRMEQRFGGTIFGKLIDDNGVMISNKAIDVNIAIMRVFVRLSEYLYKHDELASRLTQLEQKITHNDDEIIAIFEAIKHQMTLEDKSVKVIQGFSKKRE